MKVAKKWFGFFSLHKILYHHYNNNNDDVDNEICLYNRKFLPNRHHHGCPRFSSERIRSKWEWERQKNDVHVMIEYCRNNNDDELEDIVELKMGVVVWKSKKKIWNSITTTTTTTTTKTSSSSSSFLHQIISLLSI